MRLRQRGIFYGVTNDKTIKNLLAAQTVIDN